jgi:hypothetical protein
MARLWTGWKKSAKSNITSNRSNPHKQTQRSCPHALVFIRVQPWLKFLDYCSAAPDSFAAKPVQFMRSPVLFRTCRQALSPNCFMLLPSCSCLSVSIRVRPWLIPRLLLRCSGDRHRPDTIFDTQIPASSPFVLDIPYTNRYKRPNSSIAKGSAVGFRTNRSL